MNIYYLREKDWPRNVSYHAIGFSQTPIISQTRRDSIATAKYHLMHYNFQSIITNWKHTKNGYGYTMFLYDLYEL